MTYLTDYSKFIESNSEFDFKSIFLKLTEWTIPYGEEKKLEPLLYSLVPNLKKDNFGNYYINIGKSRTLFTSHLDTYSKEVKKVNHIIKGNIIKTDQTTILGGDNKNGVLILLYMIKNQIPGIYYFFIGEEGIVTGKSCNGSDWVLHNRNDIFSRVDRAIAFDRRGRGSIVTKQKARHCCSEEFANELANRFSDIGLNFDLDYAYGTDSAVFMDIVPEITNISSGGRYEHSTLESTDLSYTKKVAMAACKINWETLPTIRDPKPIISEIDSGEYTKEEIELSKKTFKKILTILDILDFRCLNIDKFSPNTVMQFEKWVEDDKLKLSILGDDITLIDGRLGGFSKGSVEDVIHSLNLSISDFIKPVISALFLKMDINGYLSIDTLLGILGDNFIKFPEFVKYITNSDYYNDQIRFYNDKIWIHSKIKDNVTKKRQENQERGIK